MEFLCTLRNLACAGQAERKRPIARAAIRCLLRFVACIHTTSLQGAAAFLCGWLLCHAAQNHDTINMIIACDGLWITRGDAWTSAIRFMLAVVQVVRICLPGCVVTCRVYENGAGTLRVLVC